MDHSGCSWVYFDNWTINDTLWGGAGWILGYNSGGGNNWKIERVTTILDTVAGGSYQNTFVHGYTGAGWKFISWTRDVTNTITKIYVSGSQVATNNIAGAYGPTPNELDLGYSGDLAMTEVWIQRDTIWNASYMSNIYAAATTRYLLATDFPNTTNLYGWRAKVS